MTHIEALELDAVPRHLIVLGGGYVGLEMSQAFRRFGSEVTIIEHGSRIVKREDADIAEAVQTFLESEGIQMLLATNVANVRGISGEAVDVALDGPAGARTLSGSHLLVAAGRRPNTAGIGLDQTGVRVDERGYIVVNEKLETTAPGVWALGECAGSPQFTHVAIDDFRVVRDNLAGGSRTTRGRQVPYCMFTDPQLARIGLGEDEAREQNVPIRVSKLPLNLVGRAKTLGETSGFMKAVVAAGSDDLLGFSMVGPEAGEVLAAVQIAMLASLPFTAVRDAIITHPTMAEGLGTLLSGIPECGSVAASQGNRS